MMKAILGMVLAAAIAGAVDKAQTFTGVVTDTMCGARHTMGIKPDDKCVRECVKMDPARWKYALLVGDDLLVFSDQQAPAKFAAQKVRVTGTRVGITKVLKADKIEAVR